MQAEFPFYGYRRVHERLERHEGQVSDIDSTPEHLIPYADQAKTTGFSHLESIDPERSFQTPTKS